MSPKECDNCFYYYMKNSPGEKLILGTLSLPIFFYLSNSSYYSWILLLLLLLLQLRYVR